MTLIRMFSLAAVLFAVSLSASAQRGGKTKYTVDVTVFGSGLVTSSTGGISCEPTCSTTVNAGTAMTLTATPDTGATFSGWGGDCAGTSATCLLTVDINKTVSASFEGGGGGGGGTTIEQLEARIAELEALVASLSSSLNGFEEQFSGISRGVDPFTNQETLYFDNINVAIRSGTGYTSSPVNGAGNLIIGYNESGGAENLPDEKFGSHNLIIGEGHTYTSYGGFIAGYDNAVTGRTSSITGGIGGLASGEETAILGGLNNTASGRWAVVSGGGGNEASGPTAYIGGGSGNVASGTSASVSAGAQNVASGVNAVVSAGDNNIASGDISAVGGGSSHVASGYDSFVAGGRWNTASGEYDTIIGGDFITCNDNQQNQSTTCGEGTISPVD